ncbi:MAG: hypothetical protein WCZ20_01270 [Hydrogenophaga sp.]
MTGSVAHRAGRLVAAIPKPLLVGIAALAIALSIAAVNSMFRGSEPAKSADTARPSLRERCMSGRDARIAEFDERMGKGDPQGAANSIRVCAKQLADESMLAMLAEAERQAHRSILADTGAPPAKRLAALDSLQALNAKPDPALVRQRARLVAEIEKAAAAARKAALAEKKKKGVSPGMTGQDVIESSWGRPERINRTDYPGGYREQWVYGGGNYLYFQNGILASIQTSR